MERRLPRPTPTTISPVAPKPVPVESKTGSTVTIAYKGPSPLILRLFREVEVSVPIMGGGQRMVKEFEETGERFYVNGVATPAGMASPSEISGGYALTNNVPLELWERWLAHNSKTDMVREGIIFATANVNDTRREASENSDISSGLEPLRLDSEGQIDDPRSKRLSKFKVRTAEEMNFELADRG